MLVLETVYRSLNHLVISPAINYSSDALLHAHSDKSHPDHSCQDGTQHCPLSETPAPNQTHTLRATVEWPSVSQLSHLRQSSTLTELQVPLVMRENARHGGEPLKSQYL